jgi:DNA-binding MarR family transcriptional regulator
MAVARLARQLRQEGAQEDASPSQLAALATLYHKAPITLGELATLERVKPPTMTRIVAALEERGLVRREHSSADGRIVRVTVTDEGRRAHEEYQKRRDAWLAVKLADLTKEERDVLSQAALIFERIVER